MMSVAYMLKTPPNSPPKKRQEEEERGGEKVKERGKEEEKLGWDIFFIHAHRHATRAYLCVFEIFCAQNIEDVKSLKM
jgi:hypothetical protein